GMDLPGTSAHYSYAASGSLYGSGMGYTDIHQGLAGDCYFLAAVSTVAHQSPGTIKNMFIDNGDGTYTIRFFDNQGAPTFVTVNKSLPVTPAGHLFYDGAGQSITSSAVKLWAPLLEKAFYQEGRFEDGYESYDNGGGDPGLATAHLTGQHSDGMHLAL